MECSILALITFLNASTKSSLHSQKRLHSCTHVECVSGLLDSGWCTLSLFLDNSPHLSADAVLALNAAAVIANIKLQAQQRQKDEQRQNTSHTATAGTPDLSWPLAFPNTNFTWNTLTFSKMGGFYTARHHREIDVFTLWAGWYQCSCSTQHTFGVFPGFL